MMSKCVFLDRDGVLNREIGKHVTVMEEFVMEEGVPSGLKMLKEAGFFLVVVTNQSGIARGYYQEAFVWQCYHRLQEACGDVLDAMYYAPGADHISRTLMRKPDSLMFEKALARFAIDPGRSWMIGDKERDLIPARKLGISTIHLTRDRPSSYADRYAADFLSAVSLILDH